MFPRGCITPAPMFFVGDAIFCAGEAIFCAAIAKLFAKIAILLIGGSIFAQTRAMRNCLKTRQGVSRCWCGFPKIRTFNLLPVMFAVSSIYLI